MTLASQQNRSKRESGSRRGGDTRDRPSLASLWRAQSRVGRLTFAQVGRMAAAPKTLEELAQRAGIELHGLREFKEADFDLLMTEQAVNATAQVKLRRQFRQLLAQELASSAQSKFEGFFARVGGADSLAGLQHVPVSTLPVALSFLRGAPGAPSEAALREAFDLLDTDGSRMLEAREVAVLVRAVDSDADVAAVLARADADENGSLDLDERRHALV